MTYKEEDRMSPVEGNAIRKNNDQIQNDLLKTNLQNLETFHHSYNNAESVSENKENLLENNNNLLRHSPISIEKRNLKEESITNNDLLSVLTKEEQLLVVRESKNRLSPTLQELTPHIPFSKSFDASVIAKPAGTGPSYERKLLKKRPDQNGDIDKLYGYHSDDASDRYRVNSNNSNNGSGSWDRKYSHVVHKKSSRKDKHLKEDSESDTKRKPSRSDRKHSRKEKHHQDDIEIGTRRKPSRHHSFNWKKTSHYIEKAYDSASPGSNRKVTENETSLSMKKLSIDQSSAQSSAAENEKDEQKKRKTSMGKRKKSLSKEQIDTKKVDDIQSEKTRRPSRFRRRRPSDQSTHGSSKFKTLNKFRAESIGTDNLIFKVDKLDSNRSKLILLYSGEASDTNKTNFEASKVNGYFNDDVPTDYDDSSAASDVENKSSKTRRPQNGLAKKVWRSINSLFQSDEKVKKVYDKSTLHIPPLSAKQLKHTKSLSNSMPGGLQRTKYDFKNTPIDRTSKDDIYLETLYKELNKSTGSLSTSMSVKKTNKLKQILKIDKDSSLRSRSLDHLLDTVSDNNTSGDNGDTDDWFKRKYSGVFKRRSSKHDLKRIANPDVKYDIVISQKPTTDKIDKPLVSKDDTYNEDVITKRISASFSIDNGRQAMEKIVTEGRKSEYTQLCLNDLKVTLHVELESFLSDKKYEPEKINLWCRVLSESIKERVVHLTEDNYKVVVQVFIGALYEDGIHAAVQSTCNNNKDGFFAVTYRGTDIFAIASILAFELE